SVRRDQRGLGLQPLGKVKLLDPGRARALVIPDSDRRTRLCGPLDQLPRRSILTSGRNRGERNLLHVENSLARFPPWPRNGVRAEYKTQPRHLLRFLDSRVFQFDIVLRDFVSHRSSSNKPLAHFWAVTFCTRLILSCCAALPPSILAMDDSAILASVIFSIASHAL